MSLNFVVSNSYGTVQHEHHLMVGIFEALNLLLMQLETQHESFQSWFYSIKMPNGIALELHKEFLWEVICQCLEHMTEKIFQVYSERLQDGSDIHFEHLKFIESYCLLEDRQIKWIHMLIMQIWRVVYSFGKKNYLCVEHTNLTSHLVVVFSCTGYEVIIICMYVS